MKAQDKPKLYKMIVEQFPNALKCVGERSQLGHVKYADIDSDWQGFSRLPVEEYENALIRHLMRLGEEGETELDHLSALAWNALAILEIKMRIKLKHPTQLTIINKQTN